MKVTRRDLLFWSAGAAAGLMVTPVPWKLLDDTSIWSQNWPWIPQPARGPVEVKQTSCTLCPNGCGMRVRMAEGWPVGVAGLTSHPVSRGALCPLGFGAHQLNWHPQRLLEVRHRGGGSTWDEARTAFAKACTEGPAVIIDGYAGRAASSVFETSVQKRAGAYRIVAGSETRALAPYERWSGVPAAAFGYDFENTQTILSFGAPLLDGWGPPGRFNRLWAERAAGLREPQLRLIQVEESLFRTAAKAWRWVPVHAGSEAALAAGLVQVLLEERLVSAHGPMPSLTLAEAAVQTGLSAEAIRELARTIVARTPAVVVANDDNPAIAALNVVLGAVGTRGGIVVRSKRGKSHLSADADVPSARAVVIDATVPWDFSPQTDAEIFRFAAWDGGSSRADWLLPAPGFLEELTDVPTAPTSAIETYAVAPGLVKAPPAVQSTAQFLGGLDSTLRTTEKVIHARCEEIFHSQRGTVIGQETTSLAKFASVQKFEEQLWKGAVWVGEPLHPGSLRFELKEWPAAVFPALTESWSSRWREPVLPPLASKLYKESTLREPLEKRKV
jgi:molybdopterin-dependent oxidoreductase iron-sulfur protein